MMMVVPINHHWRYDRRLCVYNPWLVERRLFFSISYSQCSLMNMIDSSIIFSSTKHPCRRAITTLWFKETFLWKFVVSLKSLSILLKRLAFFPPFLQSNIKYSSKFSWRSITTPYRCLLSRIFVWPIFAQIASDLWPEIIRWHLFSFSFR